MESEKLFGLLKSHIRQDEPISDDAFKQLAEIFTPSLLKKKEYFQRQNEICKHFAFVSVGCLRTFSTEKNGDEFTLYFAFPHWWVGDKTSFYGGTPARFSTQVIEDCALLIAGKEKWEKALTEIPSFERWYRNKTRKSYEATQQRLMDAHAETAEEKYLKLLEKAPEIVQRIPQHYIASYLGIKPQSLSRIRKNIFHSGKKE